MIFQFFKISKKEKRLFISAYYYCFIARASLFFVKNERYLKRIGTYMKTPDEKSQNFNTNTIAEVRLAIKRVTKYAFWNNNCLPQAIGAKRLLKKQGITSTLYLGVKKNNDHSSLEAHAWLESGGIDVVGGQNKAGFSVVGRFS